MNLAITPGAEEELREVAQHYATAGGAVLGQAFINEIQRSIELLLVSPELGNKFRRAYRHYPVRRFPYRIIYQIRADQLLVVAIAHHRRRPGYWSKR
jgi:plasmid stabilization system protein ParE